MSPRQIRAVRVAKGFMPKLWDFAYPTQGRGYRTGRRVALAAWIYAFKLRVKLLDV